MHGVVGLENQRVQHRHQHAPVVMAVGGTHGFLNFPFEVEAHGLELGHQFFQGLLWHHRINDLFDDSLRLIDGSLGQLEQKTCLAANLLEGDELFLVDLLLGTGTQVMDHLQEQVDQRIGELLLASPTKHGHHAVADRSGVTSEFTDGFGRAALPELVDEFGRNLFKHFGSQTNLVDTLEFGNGDQQAV